METSEARHYLKVLSIATPLRVKNNCWPLAVFRAKLPNGQSFPKVVGPFGQSIVTRHCHFMAGAGSLLHTTERFQRVKTLCYPPANLISLQYRASPLWHMIVYSLCGSHSGPVVLKWDGIIMREVVRVGGCGAWWLQG